MSSTISKPLLKFLEYADALYIEAYQTRRYGILFDDFTVPAMEAVNLSVIHNGGLRYFAEKHYRKNTWEILEETDTEIKILKTQIFKSIHINLFRTMKASQDYTEEWTVLKGNQYIHGFKVDGISQEVYI